MTIGILRDQAVWLGGYDFSGVFSALGLNYGADLVDKTTLQETSHRRLPGLKNVTVAHEGFFDADPFDAQLHGNIGLADVPMSIANGIAEGDPAYALLATQGEYSAGGPVGEMFAFSVGAESAGGDGLIRGTLMHNAARTTTANGTARQLGAVVAPAKLFAALHVTAAAGTTPTLDVTIESDDAMGFTTPVTRITFGQKVAIASEWATPIAAPITDDWWRVAWAIGGAGPSFTFTVVVGIQ